ncbi:MAG: DUF2299 family protein [Deltaproteobacteria bacterium]|nr:DUF2299 family protein [Deltaproteobacteria bacterium]
MEITTPEQARDAIKKWLAENQHKINEVKDENANFHFELDYPLGSQKRQRVIQPKEYPGLIVLLNGVSLAPEHVEKLKKMKDDKREGFYSEIRDDLIFAENSYDMDLGDEGVAKQIQFSYEFYIDTLTKTHLFKGLLLNHRTLLYIVTKFNDKFGTPVMPTAPKEQGIAGTTLQ